MVCTSCQKPKSGLRKRKSKLLGTNLFLCSVCFDKKFEPRYAVIIRFQETRDLVDIADYLRNHRYVGNEITALELL